MTPAPISVERLCVHTADHGDDRKPYGMMMPDARGEYVRHSDYTALLHQLATVSELSELRRQAAACNMEMYNQEYKRAEAAESKLAERDAEVERLRGLLGRCYVLAGADTDGNPPEKCADWAVRAVNDLRHDYDEAGDECERLRQAVMHQEGKASEWCIRASAAERAREEATGLLREALMGWDDLIEEMELNGMHDDPRFGCYRKHKEWIGAVEAKASAAFLAASGGKAQ